jgi:hypothetical protein
MYNGNAETQAVQFTRQHTSCRWNLQLPHSAPSNSCSFVSIRGYSAISFSVLAYVTLQINWI